MENEQWAVKNVVNDKTVADSNLIKLEGGVKDVPRVSDINVKINLLESSLVDLQSELDNINSSVDAGLERLGDSDLDLTSKVSETYKRLGEIDNTYRTLSEISSNIDSEVKKLTSEITTVAALSAADLERLESSASVLNMELNVQHEQLVLRVNELVKHSTETSAQLSKSIQHNTATLLKLEKELVAEINSLANVTQDRDNALTLKLGEAEQEIENSKARILKMQKVDEALDGRASALETTTTELVNKIREIDSDIELLDLRSRDLSASVEALQAESTRQASLIVDIQQQASQTRRSLSALVDTVGRHFRLLGGALAVALLAIVSLYFYQSSQHADEALVTAQRSLEMDRNIAGMKQEVVVSELAIAGVKQELLMLNEQLNDEVKVVNGRLLTMDDQVQSLDGRISHTSPFSQFGKDSVIHGPQWLKQQPAQNMAILIATVNDKKQLYETAQRYSHYFKEDMSYYTVSSGRGATYVLVYGNFADTNRASSAIWQLPRYINNQRPQIINVGDIQRFI